MNIESLFLIIGSIAVGIVPSFIIYQKKITSFQKELDDKKDDIIEKANQKAQAIRRKAKTEMREELESEKKQLENEFKKKTDELNEKEKSLTKKEVALDQKIEARDRERDQLKDKEREIEKVKEDALAEKQRYIIKQEDIAKKLEVVAQMTAEQAKEELMNLMTEEARVDAAKMIAKIEEEAKEESEKKAKRIISIALQRFSGEYVAEQTIATVELPGDEIKGRLIGREGRNIRAFEQICGVDLIIDDTPGMVVVSCFNVVRKEIAKMTIEKLISDGRIHPAKIEEFHDKSKAELESSLRDLGEKAQMELGIHGLHPEVLKMLGALNYRTSYTQNQYQHSLEVGMLCGAMAAELGLNVKQARRAGLLHDIGKAIDASAEGSHAVVGADFIKKYGEDPDIVHAVRAHHEDVPPETVLAHLVMAADALSGARPGVRKFLKESYVSRVADIENIANTFEGVQRSYAISAGREIRVLVSNDKVSDEQTVVLSREIAKKIEEEMSYPGTIKVSVIRETKAVGIAK